MIRLAPTMGPKLKEWLHNHNAYQVDGGWVGDRYVSRWRIGSSIALIEEWSMHDTPSWEIYTPLGSNEIETALSDAWERVK